MKKTMINFRTAAMALVTFVTLGFTQSTYAAPGAPADIKFIGTALNNLPVFQLTLANSANEEYTVTVRSADKQKLFTETLKGQNITRNYKLDVEDVFLLEGTTFEVKNKKTNETSVYTVNSTTRTIENTVVTKL